MKSKIVSYPRLPALAAALVRALRKGDVVLLDESLREHHAAFCARLQGKVLCLRGGESVKRWDELGRVLAFLSEQEVERGATLYVVGGGALCDLGAFAAGLYRRGMRLVLVPTSLLAAADAAIGGKTAVDLSSEGRLVKNAAGIFYPASAVWLSTAWFVSLPVRERRSGAAEILKILWLHGEAIETEGLAAWCAGGAKMPKGLAGMLGRSLVLKQKIVEKDFEDRKGLRARLNFGHSLGHAIESLGHGRLSHGEAVAWGMWAECAFVKAEFAHEIYFVLEALGFAWPRFLSKLGAGDWEKLLRQDKKMRAKKLELVALKAPGKPVTVAVDPAKLAAWAADFFTKSAVL